MQRNTLCELETVKHTPRDQGSVSLNASYHKKQQYIWFNGGDLNGSEILSYVNRRGLGIQPGDPRLVSLNASYHNEQQHIWFRGEILNGF